MLQSVCQSTTSVQLGTEPDCLVSVVEMGEPGSSKAEPDGADFTSSKTIPRESNSWPILNWFCVMPTSRRKKSVMALPLNGRKPLVNPMDTVALPVGRRSHEGRVCGGNMVSNSSHARAWPNMEASGQAYLLTRAFSSASVQLKSSPSLWPSWLRPSSTNLTSFSAITEWQWGWGVAGGCEPEVVE